jgi:hypothetical protein
MPEEIQRHNKASEKAQQ